MSEARPTMRVATYRSNSDIRIEEVPLPVIGPGEILVEVVASGICGSDVMEWYRVPRAPLVLGHEIAGDIVEAGQGADRYPIGERVFVSHHVPCNICELCLAGHHTACETLHTTNFDPGGFAEYVRVPALQVDRGVFPLPDEMSYEDGTFVEPLGCVVRAWTRSPLRPGANVLIVGSGISGLLHIKTAAALGAGRIVAADVTDYRLEAARRAGADTVMHSHESLPVQVRETLGGRLADHVVLCTGAAAALRPAVESVASGGTVVLFAPPPPGEDIALPLLDLWRRDVTITTSYGAAPSDLAMAMDLLTHGRIEVADLVTHRLPLAETAEGFRLVAEAGESIKVIIEPQR